MRITEISKQKKREDRYNIYTEEGFLLSLSDETIVKNAIAVDKELTPALLESLRREDTLKYAKELALVYVSHGARTQKEVEKHLIGRGIDAASASEAISMLIDYGYINDEAYAKEFCRIYSSKMGSRLIAQKLVLKGIDKELASRLSKENEQAQENAAQKLAQKYLEKYKNEPEFKRRGKAYAALIRKGFSYEEAASAVKADELYD